MRSTETAAAVAGWLMRASGGMQGTLSGYWPAPVTSRAHFPSPALAGEGGRQRASKTPSFDGLWRWMRVVVVHTPLTPTLSRTKTGEGATIGSGLGLSDERGLQSNLGGFGRVDRREPTGIRHERGREGVAAILHLRPRTFLAIFDRFTGDDRERERDPLGDVLALELLHRQLQGVTARVRRRSIGNAWRSHRSVRSICAFDFGADGEHLDAPAIRAFAGAWLQLIRLLARFDLHRVRGVAAHLRPQPIDLVPGVGSQNLRQFRARDRLAPHADRFRHDFDVRMLGEHFLRGLRAQRIDGSSGHARYSDDIALAVEVLDQPLGSDPAGFFLIDRDVVGAGLADVGVI